MKRKEMIRAIEMVLANVQMESSESRANRVLKIIEHKGMLPPLYTVEDAPNLLQIHGWEDEEPLKLVDNEK